MRYRMTITIELPFAIYDKHLRGAGAVILRTSHDAPASTDMLLAALGLAVLHPEARAYAVACGDVPSDVAELLTIPEGVCVTIEEVPNAD